MHVNAAVNLACDGAADTVDNAKYKSAFALHFASCCERVEGFTGLADNDVKRVCFYHRLAIAKLGCGFCIRWYACQCFYHLRAGHTCIERRATT